MKPVLQALLLAERVYQDAITRKKVIAGTFNTLQFSHKLGTPKEVEIDGVKRLTVPGGMDAGSPCAFVSLTEVRGKVACILRYVDLQEDKPRLECKFEIHATNPLQTVEVVIPMPKLPVDKAGIFALELLCDDEPIGSLRITVVEIKETPNVNDD